MCDYILGYPDLSDELSMVTTKRNLILIILAGHLQDKRDKIQLQILFMMHGYWSMSNEWLKLQSEELD